MTVFRPIHHARTAEEVAHQIEALILEGLLTTGDRLPGERDLAVSMGVSRPIVRQAIGDLEKLGLLESRHGEGTYVADVIGTVFSPQVSSLLGSHHKATMDYLEYRREIEAVAARFAAERATEDDRLLLKGLCKRMKAAYKAGDFDLEAAVDIEFHSFIGEIAHNLVLMHTLRACYRLLSEGVFQNRKRLYCSNDARRQLLDQHLEISEAILAADPNAAQEAARAHLDYVIERTREFELAAERERVAGLRRARQSAI